MTVTVRLERGGIRIDKLAGSSLGDGWGRGSWSAPPNRICMKHPRSSRSCFLQACKHAIPPTPSPPSPCPSTLRLRKCAVGSWEGLGRGASVARPWRGPGATDWAEWSGSGGPRLVSHRELSDFKAMIQLLGLGATKRQRRACNGCDAVRASGSEDTPTTTRHGETSQSGGRRLDGGNKPRLGVASSRVASWMGCEATSCHRSATVPQCRGGLWWRPGGGAGPPDVPS